MTTKGDCVHMKLHYREGTWETWVIRDLSIPDQEREKQTVFLREEEIFGKDEALGSPVLLWRLNCTPHTSLAPDFSRRYLYT